MNQLQDLLTQRILSFKLRNVRPIDDILDDPKLADMPGTRNVCAKLSIPLSQEIDEVCSLLDVSKRRFIEAAIIHALREARRLMDELDMYGDEPEPTEHDYSRALDSND